jgi:RNA polymerase-binding transcription factor DksA
MNHSRSAEYREQLEQQKAELSERVSKIRADIGRGLEADSAEQATQLENSEVLNALVHEGEHELVQVKSALLRIDDGTFGACAACGEMISDERLNALPYSGECISCASKHD